MRSKIIVTGGAGFIGSHIVEHWVKQNADVHVLDNLSSGYKKNIEQFNITFHEGNITDKDLVFRLLEGADYVHHLAAMVSVPESVADPFGCVEINVKGLLNILEAAVKHKIKKIIHSSSAAVYGENPESPKTVKMRPMPKSPYGITKLDGEFYLDAYYQNYGLEAVSLRYFNVFGPRQDPNSQYAAAIPIFIQKALKNETITIYGDGEQTRDFIYVKDVVQANILAALSEVKNGVYNVGNEKSITINELARLVISETGSSSKIVFENERPGDIKHSLSSIAATRTDLGFEPKHDLILGLKETIQYFIKILK